MSKMNNILIIFERQDSVESPDGLKFLYKIPMNTYVC